MVLPVICFTSTASDKPHSPVVQCDKQAALCGFIFLFSFPIAVIREPPNAYPIQSISDKS